MENVTSLYGVAISCHEDKITKDMVDMIDNIVTERLLIMRKVKMSNNVNFYDLLAREIADLFDESWNRYFKEHLLSKKVSF